jgi:hypothetical protein
MTTCITLGLHASIGRDREWKALETSKKLIKDPREQERLALRMLMYCWCPLSFLLRNPDQHMLSRRRS